MLSTLAGAIGNSHVVEIKKGWIEGAVLYIAVVGDPGSKKTPALKVAIAPAKERQVALQRAFREAMNEYHAEVRQWQLDKKRAGENDEPAPPPPEQPVLQRTIVSDTTVEALAELLQENLRGLNCIRDELAGWWRSMDQYKGGKGSDRQVWLEIWSTGFSWLTVRVERSPCSYLVPLSV
jgi:putative DNA primase/helicase